MDWSHLAAVAIGALLKPVFWPIKRYMWDRFWPAFLDHKNRHTTLAGRWRVAHSGNPSDGDLLEASWAVEVNLEQMASAVTGMASASCTTGKSTGKMVHYEARGNFASGVLDITFQDSDRSGRNRSTFLMQMVGDGSTLEGHRLFLGRNKNDIRSIPCKWIRNGDANSGCGTA